MPLYIDRNVIYDDGNVFKSLDIFVQKYGRNFHSRNNELISRNVQRISSSMDCLYVNQRELATIGQCDEKIRSLGSDMATTCHIVVLRCPHTRATSLAHFDGAGTQQGVQDMISSVSTMSKQSGDADAGRFYELHIVGGFDDDRDISRDLSLQLLKCFYEFSGRLDLNLMTFCCTTLNQKLVASGGITVKSPIVFGLVVMVESGDISPAVFDDDAKGPACDVRSVRSLHGPRAMTNIYNYDTYEVVIQPYTYGKFDDVSDWIEAPDFIIRKYLSTSPEVEPVNFEATIRRSLKFIRDNPDPLRSVFTNSECLRFKKVGSCWIKAPISPTVV